MKTLVAGIGAFFLFCVFMMFALALTGLGYYNTAVNLEETVHKQWAQVDNALQRRFDLIPSLVETVKGAGIQEQKVFLGIAEARQGYFSAKSTADKAVAAGTLESALSRLLMFKEEYPQLRSNENFLKLQDSIEGSENRLSVERGKYNERVAGLNQFIRGFPSSFFASLAGVEKAEYFEIPEEAKAVPKVNFTGETTVLEKK